MVSCMLGGVDLQPHIRRWLRTHVGPALGCLRLVGDSDHVRHSRAMHGNVSDFLTLALILKFTAILKSKSHTNHTHHPPRGAEPRLERGGDGRRQGRQPVLGCWRETHSATRGGWVCQHVREGVYACVCICVFVAGSPHGCAMLLILVFSCACGRELEEK